MLREARLPYIVVLTDPTFGGVSASYAMLGDVQIAEPGAQIGFTGARVIAQTIRAQLPEGFQRAEYLLEHGLLDMVVPRKELRETLSRIVHLLDEALAPEEEPSGARDRHGSGLARRQRPRSGGAGVSWRPPSNPPREGGSKMRSIFRERLIRGGRRLPKSASRLSCAADFDPPSRGGWDESP